ncbi:hypothetical protein VTN00DRAFT_71 [Thermoascus crustaceus]|uniref:uncharacterized protein n=1 Tax=Thermoascus crustaceus TaxID=5088 RepID=UPI0037431AB4
MIACRLPPCAPRSQGRSFSSSVHCFVPNHSQAQQSRSSSNVDGYNHHLGQRAREKLADREFFLSLLSSASTKREAKSYLSRFRSEPVKTQPKRENEKEKEPDLAAIVTAKSGVNLGAFYGASRTVYESPVFRQESTPQPAEDPNHKLHLALVKITTPQHLDDDTIQGIGRTLSQLTRLGMSSCVVIDPGPIDDVKLWRATAVEQADRLSAAIDINRGPKSLRLDSVITVTESDPNLPKALKVLPRKALLTPLHHGRTVVVVPVGYTEDSPKAVPLSANDVVLALTKEFAGLGITPDPDEDPTVAAQRIDGLQNEVSVDRLILLDPLGGIPAFSGPQKSHVFINMEQEYEDIEDELLRNIPTTAASSEIVSDDLTTLSSIANSNPISKFVNQDVVPLPTNQHPRPLIQGGRSPLEGHLANLRLSQQTLALLPPSSSGIITTPTDVANSARAPRTPSHVSAVGTRRQRNPLIHNLLTDKPSHSSSLPLSRLGVNNGQASMPVTHSTFVKRGMPLTMLPDPRVKAWTAGNGGEHRLRLDDPRIDLGRLVYLIEDSFNRKLDVQHYMDRINDRIAGLIIAGEYEGGAILTWETPPGVVDDGSEANLSRMVPYLDKFAVLKRSQGAGGVADIVFNAMVRSCFPNGVCWRSRRNNPVNKWYFERARGTWKLPNTNWTMFWTTPGVPENTQTFQDYEGVCRSIQPSWADNKQVVD